MTTANNPVVTAELSRALQDARSTLTTTATSHIGSDELTIPRGFFDSVVRNIDRALAMAQASPPPDEMVAVATKAILEADTTDLLTKWGYPEKEAEYFAIAALKSIGIEDQG